MLRWNDLFASRLSKGLRRKRRQDSLRMRRLRVEALEDRRMLATITVTSAADNLDPDDLITLREAIQAANMDMSVDGSTAGNGADIIDFAATLNGDTIVLADQELEITETLSIDATSLSSGITVDANLGSRIFNISATEGDYSFLGLTLTQGRITGSNADPGESTYSGGAIRSVTTGSLEITETSILDSSTSGAYAMGGGLFAVGDVTISGSRISGNTTDGSFSRGGGVFTEGPLVINTSTISGNFTSGGFSGGGGLATYGSLMLTDSTVNNNITYGDYSSGGGVRVSQTAIINQSTISGNITAGFMSNGGGVASFGELAIHNSTIADNQVSDDSASGGGVWNQIVIIVLANAFVANGEHDVEIANTIIATNTALGGNPDLELNHVDLAVHYSLIGDTSGLSIGQINAINSGPGNKINVDPLLDALTNNGGPTQTHYLMTGSPAINMGDPTVTQAADQFDQRGTPFLRVYGGRLDIGALEVIVDEVGPQVNGLRIFGHSDFDLLNPKPSEDGPTPWIDQLVVEFIDFPVRDIVFTDGALNTALAENEALYSVVGDRWGNISIQSAQIIASSIAVGQPASATVLLTFFEPLPDDRFTFTVFDSITDPTGNNLDGESNIVPPINFPSGDGVPGGDFIVQFVVDSRAEIGAWAAGSVLIDANGNFILDPGSFGIPNGDLAYRIGYGSDYIFAGKFSVRDIYKKVEEGEAVALNGVLQPIATGFDTIAAYGRVSGNQYRWLIDTDDNGVADKTYFEPVGAGINGYPVAGEFDGNHENGDEVGLFDGKFWYFDTDHDFNVSDETPVQALDYSGFPIAGDFDGDFIDEKDFLVQALVDHDFDGDDDVATYIASSAGGNLFSIDINEADPGDPIEIDGIADFSFRVGSPNTGGFGFPGARERPVAADFNGDGIDDFGLWVPDGIVPVPNELSEWYLLLSGDDPFTVNVEESVLDRIQDGPLNGFVPFSPEPFGNDLYAQFGNTFSLPIAGNFDPPSPIGPGGFVAKVPSNPPIIVPQVTVPTVDPVETPPIVKVEVEPADPVVPKVEEQPLEEEPVTVAAAVQIIEEKDPEVSSELQPSVETAAPKTEEVVEETIEKVVEPVVVKANVEIVEKIEKPQPLPPVVEEPEQIAPPQPVLVENKVKESAPPVIVAAVQEPTKPEPKVVPPVESVVVEITPELPIEEITVAPVEPIIPTYSRSRVRSISYGGSHNVVKVSTSSGPLEKVIPVEIPEPVIVAMEVEIPTALEIVEPPKVEVVAAIQAPEPKPTPAPNVNEETDDSELSAEPPAKTPTSQQSKVEEAESPPQNTATDNLPTAKKTRSRTRTLIFSHSQRTVSMDESTDTGVAQAEQSTASTDAAFDDPAGLTFSRVDAEAVSLLVQHDQDAAEESEGRNHRGLTLALADGLNHL